MRPNTLQRRLALTFVALAVVIVLLVVSAVALSFRLYDAQSTVVDRLFATYAAASDLNQALLDQETGYRGYALTTRPEFLKPLQRRGAPGRPGRASARASRGRLPEPAGRPAPGPPRGRRLARRGHHPGHRAGPRRGEAEGPGPGGRQGTLRRGAGRDQELPHRDRHEAEGRRARAEPRRQPAVRDPRRRAAAPDGVRVAHLGGAAPLGDPAAGTSRRRGRAGRGRRPEPPGRRERRSGGDRGAGRPDRPDAVPHRAGVRPRRSLATGGPRAPGRSSRSRPRICVGPTPSSSSSPTSPRTTCRSRCARSPASASSSSAATRASSTSVASSTSSSPSTGPSGCSSSSTTCSPSRGWAGPASDFAEVDLEDVLVPGRAPARGAARRRRRCRDARPAADGRGRREPAGPAVPEPGRQRGEVPRRRSRPGCTCRPPVGGGPSSGSVSCSDNGIGIEEQYARQDLRDLPAAARSRRVRRHGHRAGDVQEDRGVSRRPIWLDTEPRDASGAVFRWTLPERQPAERAYGTVLATGTHPPARQGDSQR